MGAGALAAPAAAASQPELRDVRLWSSSKATRVVVDLSRESKYKFFVLQNPARAVLDLKDTRAPSLLRLPTGEGPVKSLRVGAQANGSLRVVVDLHSERPVMALVAPAARDQGFRIIIDVGSTDPIVDSPVGVSVADTDAAAPRLLEVPAAHDPGDAGRDIVVAVDAGHGGIDSGAIGPRGTQEKDVVLQIARALAARIDREPGMRAVLTRNDDHFIVLRDRMNRARAAKADMFVSVHADAVRDRSVAGASVYVLSEKGATDEQALWLAERENAADLKGGVSLDDKDAYLASVLLDLSQTASISASMAAAEKVLRAIDRVGVVRRPAVQQAGFIVLKSPDIPSMLVETAYISNPTDEARLRRAEHRKELADAIFAGVRRYFETFPPDGTRFAQAARMGSPATARAAP
jgi:N-acetylmuramoyl-L-alanine amidase